MMLSRSPLRLLGEAGWRMLTAAALCFVAIASVLYFASSACKRAAGPSRVG